MEDDATDDTAAAKTGPHVRAHASSAYRCTPPLPPRATHHSSPSSTNPSERRKKKEDKKREKAGRVDDVFGKAGLRKAPGPPRQRAKAEQSRRAGRGDVTGGAPVIWAAK